MRHQETLAIRCDIGARCGDIGAWRGNIGARAEFPATSALTRSFRRHRRGVSGDIGDCGVGITPQMCNRVTNHADMSTFSKQALREDSISNINQPIQLFQMRTYQTLKIHYRILTAIQY